MDRFCTKCGQKLAENAIFCTSCGSRVEAQEIPLQGQPTSSQNTHTVPNQSTYNTPNQSTYNTPNQNTYSNPNPNMYGGAPNMYPNQNPKGTSNNSLATALSVVGLVLSILGAILFGLFLSIPAIILGVVGLLMAVNVKKATNNASGNAPMVCGILAIIFGIIFSIGCMAVNCADPTGYTKYGVIGGGCKLNSDVNDVYEDIYDYSNWFN